MEDKKPRFKKGPPDVAPHLVLQEMAEVAHAKGYYIRDLSLVYYLEGGEYKTEVSRIQV